MKIEKINDDQIRCTLTMEDLAEREIRIHELAYGTEKARNLFRDMIEEAYRQFGFTVDNVPIMIEAVPFSNEGLVLVITKVENPEELDTRYSKFTEISGGNADRFSDVTGADDVIDLIHRLYEARKKASGSSRRAVKESTDELKEEKREEKKEEKEEKSVDLVKMFSFKGIDEVIRAAASVAGIFRGESSLYRLRKNGEYLLIVHKGESTPEDYNRVCNILSEYGQTRKHTAAFEAHLAEQEEPVLEETAISKLNSLL
ncbi:MAG: adaptor protein MecA [Lachnospiraceae bacterium]|nr:adaptor protein MecA [Lachnospiraceae bacterium]